ncbi:MAG: DUF3108 domain-containing protein [Betaproteobacteria bacterium]|nr:DUF3108 domain-containing protein [Betaproteobacteria bacterium]
MSRGLKLHFFIRVALALVASLLLHALLFLASPNWADIFSEEPPSHFDAVLLPASVTKRPAAAQERPKPAATASRRPRSAATFSAPDNTLAAAPAVPTTAAEVPTEEQSSEPDLTPLAAMPQINTALPALEVLNPFLPSRIQIAYQLQTSITNGSAELAWSKQGNQYDITSSVRATGVAGLFVGKIRQSSRGEITPQGLKPTAFSMQRGKAEAENADFLYTDKVLRLTRHQELHTLPLPARIQDMQSFLFQLAFDVPRLQPNETHLTVLVTNARKVYRYEFKLLGEETLTTPLGPLTTLHLLSEAARPEDAYEVWLSRDHWYLPVKLKFFLGRFPVEQQVTSIRASED